MGSLFVFIIKGRSRKKRVNCWCQDAASNFKIKVLYKVKDGGLHTRHKTRIFTFLQ